MFIHVKSFVLLFWCLVLKVENLVILIAQHKSKQPKQKLLFMIIYNSLNRSHSLPKIKHSYFFFYSYSR